ncbi:fumarylacetoacetate hydrolase family protein [Halobacillus sp. Marseille-Q1614]|uniref:fumarylacetoacetate hydrolase family protein n=1 Tax=Halobacillus sp. Marseille-Q1614 TaxID=2709134 RepID=UPI00157110DC|nr:fumarylacetoacetate hydrolase family protein [Halobacillus sp. Marseille-Q1614]
MKLVRFIYENTTYYGELSQEGIHIIAGDIFNEWEYTGEIVPENQAKLLAPIEPSKVIGIGANYVGSEEELPEKLPELPVFFFKPSSSVVGPEADVQIPDLIDEVKFESELAVVIGKEMRNVEKENVLDYVFGYTIGNDITAPQFFHEDGHWTLGKSFDTFTPIGPCIETELDPSQISVKANINDEEKQNSPTSLMIVPLAEMISYLSKVMTLKPGDCILTGSPLGAHFVQKKDVVECKIDEIGTLRNKLVKTSVAVPGSD